MKYMLAVFVALFLVLGVAAGAIAENKDVDLRHVCSLENSGRELFRIKNTTDTKKFVSIKALGERKTFAVKPKGTELKLFEGTQGSAYNAKLKDFYTDEVYDVERITFKRC